MIQIIDKTFSPTEWNTLATHPMQSWEWGKVRQHEGKKIARFAEYSSEKVMEGVYLMTIHPLPFTPYAVGYIPKSTYPSKEFLSYLKSYAHAHNLIFIKLEPNITNFSADNNSVMVSLSKSDIKSDPSLEKLMFVRSPHPLFTSWNQTLDITPSDQDLLANMHPKTRYNIHLAQKKGVQVHEMNSDQGYQIFEKLYFETCARQKYRGHSPAYHQNIWNTLSSVDSRQSSELKPYESYEPSKQNQPSTLNLTNLINLSSHILVAFYKDTPLAAYQLWHFKDTLYYVYGGSSEEYKNVMAPNLLMWEAIRFGKSLGCKTFDMWGSLPPSYDTKDPWAGFTKFKKGYGTSFVQYAGSYDLVVNSFLYQLYSLAQTLRQRLFL